MCVNKWNAVAGKLAKRIRASKQSNAISAAAAAALLLATCCGCLRDAFTCRLQLMLNLLPLRCSKNAAPLPTTAATSTTSP